MRANTCTSPIGLMLLATASAATGQTITVTTSADVVDVASSAPIADLPGPDGVVSFREALLVSDNEPGHQTIGFAIPEDDWYLPDIYPGLVLLQGSFSFSASEPVTIDGTTQTAFTGDTFPGGNELILPLQTYLGGDGTVVTGLHASRVEVSGSSSEFYGNTGDMYIVLYFGTGSHIHDNEAWTIKITQSNDNVIVRNTTERVRITGAGASGPPASGNRIGGPDAADRNLITGFGNYGEHGVPGGDCIELYYTDNTLIQNNYIGTTPDGMAISNQACTIGIAMHNKNDNVIVRNNLLAIRAIGVGPASGVLYGQEVYIGLYLGGSGIEITGNTMGLNALGEAVLGGVNGVLVSRYAFEDGADVSVGGPNPGQGNVIAGHSSTGVLMMNGPGVPATGHVRLSGNSIYTNGEIGIDLMPNTWDFGPTPNDPLDVDAGANGLQNFPVLTAAQSDGMMTTTIEGNLNSAPNASYRLEFFANDLCDPSGHGQGQTFLGDATVMTDAGGNAAFAVVLPAPAEGGQSITATATDLAGNTSEFSACRLAEYAGGRGDCDGNGTVNLVDFATFSSCFGLTAPSAACDATDFACCDLDDNGTVNLTDFATFALNFAG